MHNAGGCTGENRDMAQVSGRKNGWARDAITMRLSTMGGGCIIGPWGRVMREDATHGRQMKRSLGLLWRISWESGECGEAWDEWGRLGEKCRSTMSWSKMPGNNTLWVHIHPV
jgi:hypothetical protein